jgi:alkylation response protein AidB-like acyl-CoA dehydrogenase
MVTFELTEEQNQLQAMVRAFAKSEVRPALRKLEKAGLGAELKAKYAELGLAGIDWPEAAGGAAMGTLARALVEEELAYGDLGAAFALDGQGAAATFLLAVNTPAAHAILKDALGSGATLAFAAAEEGKGQDDFRTTAQKSGDGWVLTGKKAFVLRGGDAGGHVVLAQIEAGKGLAGAGAFLVRAGNTGLRAGKVQSTLGLNAVPMREVVVEGCKVAASDRLDAPGTLTQVLRRFYDRFALITAARAVGAAAAAFEYARAYAEERTAFGKPIGHFQAVAFTLADMATAVDAARWLLWKACWSFDRSPSGGERGDSQSGGEAVTVECASAQAQAQEAAWFVTNSAIQVLGGAGYVQDHPVEKWSRDARTLGLVGLHTQAAHATIAAVELGSPADAADLFPLPSLHASLA